MGKANSVLRRLLPYTVLLVMILFFGLTSSDFFTWRNINTLLRDTALLGIVSSGITLVMLGGGVDLSVGSIVGLVLVVEARMLSTFHTKAIIAVGVGLLVGLACGLFNAFIINRLHLVEFIATLATQMVFRGLCYILGEKDRFGTLVTSTIKNRVFKGYGGTVGGIYYVTIAWIIVVVVGMIVLKKTKFGVYTYARGSNLQSAGLSGINTTKMSYALYLISGLMAALAGTYLFAWSGGSTYTAGVGYEFNAISTFIVGTTVFAGGVGDTLGTAAGTLFMKLITNGLYKYGLPTEFQFIAQGILILALGGYSSIRYAIADSRRKKAAFENDKKAALEGGKQA